MENQERPVTAGRTETPAVIRSIIRPSPYDARFLATRPESEQSEGGWIEDTLGIEN
jgi:hypothetical protein